MAANDDVIGQLVRDLRPVRPLPLPTVRTASWALAAAALAALVTVLLGVRADLRAISAVGGFQVHAALLFVAALASSGAALASAVPGELTSAWRRVAPFFVAAAWCSWLIAEVAVAAQNGRWEPVARGWGCVAKALAITLVPSALLIAMIARAASPNVRRTCIYAALASSAVGALGVEITCPISNPLHLLLWHAGPMVAAVPLAVGVAMIINRRCARHLVRR